MELDGEEGSPEAGQTTEARDYGIIPDFDELDDDLKEDDSPKAEETLQERIQALNSELDKMAPNMRAVDRLEATSARLHSTERDFQAARRAAARAKEAFEEVRERRAELFNKYDVPLLPSIPASFCPQLFPTRTIHFNPAAMLTNLSRTTEPSNTSRIKSAQSTRS